MADKHDDNEQEGPGDDEPMSFFDHLIELRRRLVRAAFGVTAAFVGCWIAVDYLRAIILSPFEKAWNTLGMDGEAHLLALGALETFLTDLRIAIIAALFIAGPILFHQAWMFVSPGLYKREKKLVVPFVACSGVMFAGGAVFCYLFVIPVATEFFLNYSLEAGQGSTVDITPSFTYSDYVQYSTRLLLGFGLMFEFPLGVFFLAKAGVITHKTLLRYWKPAILFFFVAGALLTPPEPITQILMAFPMIGLYFASIGVAYIVGKDERQRVAELDAELAEDDGDDKEDDPDDEDDPGERD